MLPTRTIHWPKWNSLERRIPTNNSRRKHLPRQFPVNKSCQERGHPSARFRSANSIQDSALERSRRVDLGDLAGGLNQLPKGSQIRTAVGTCAEMGLDTFESVLVNHTIQVEAQLLSHR
jgi:hypothetical protein